MNLTADDEADDFYRRVAFRAHRIEPDLMDGPFDRAIVKQPAMSYFYGSRPGGFAKKGGKWRPHGMTRQIIDALDRRVPGAKAKELAHAIYTVIEGMVPRAKAVRDFLEQLAKLCAADGKPLRWTTPLGLPVINRYHGAKKEQLTVPLRGRPRHVTLVVGDKEGIDRIKATNAVTANFVHSVDAAHLMLTALAADFDMVTVHDCFGCLAPHAARLNTIIREQFVRLHKRHNVLAEVWASARRDLPKDIKLPPLPATGELEIEDVLTSEFAFS